MLICLSKCPLYAPYFVEIFGSHRNDVPSEYARRVKRGDGIGEHGACRQHVDDCHRILQGLHAVEEHDQENRVVNEVTLETDDRVDQFVARILDCEQRDHP